MKIETVSIGKLKPHPRNYVQHPDDQIQHIVESLRENGFYRNIIVAKDWTILAGHGVVMAAKVAGFSEVPVRRLDISPNDPRAIKVLVGDNEISNLREQDDRALTNLLREIAAQDDGGLLGTGYDESMLSALLLATRTEDEIPDIDAAREWADAGMPEHHEGDTVFRLNIMCRSEEKRAEAMRILGYEDSARRSRGTETAWYPREDA